MRELAQRIYPPLLDTGGLRTSLRSAAAAAGVPTSVEVATGQIQPPEMAAAVYFCCVEALECVGDGAALAINIREADGVLVFEIVEQPPGVATATEALAPMRERVEALGGRLAIASDPGQGLRISGSLPVSRCT
jgi:signal transduction histidine kinase